MFARTRNVLRFSQSVGVYSKDKESFCERPWGLSEEGTRGDHSSCQRRATQGTALTHIVSSTSLSCSPLYSSSYFWLWFLFILGLFLLPLLCFSISTLFCQLHLLLLNSQKVWLSQHPSQESSAFMVLVIWVRLCPQSHQPWAGLWRPVATSTLTYTRGVSQKRDVDAHAPEHRILNSKCARGSHCYLLTYIWGFDSPKYLFYVFWVSLKCVSASDLVPLLQNDQFDFFTSCVCRKQGSWSQPLVTWTRKDLLLLI